MKDGKGALTRTLGLLGAILAWGIENGYVDHNSVRGVRRFAGAKKKALLTAGQCRALADALAILDSRQDGKGHRLHNAIGLAAIRFIALTGVRREEYENLRWDEVDANGNCLFVGRYQDRGFAAPSQYAGICRN